MAIPPRKPSQTWAEQSSSKGSWFPLKGDIRNRKAQPPQKVPSLQWGSVPRYIHRWSFNRDFRFYIKNTTSITWTRKSQAKGDMIEKKVKSQRCNAVGETKYRHLFTSIHIYVWTAPHSDHRKSQFVRPKPTDVASDVTWTPWRSQHAQTGDARPPPKHPWVFSCFLCTPDCCVQ